MAVEDMGELVGREARTVESHIQPDRLLLGQALQRLDRFLDERNPAQKLRVLS